MNGEHLASGVFLRRRLPVDRGIGGIGGIVLFVHGATIGSVLFDLPAPGLSLLQACADAGHAAYALDLRGYARSARPRSMSLQPQQCPVLCTGAEAIVDIGEAVDHILRKHGATSLALAGGSWGSLTAARYAAACPDKVARLALLAPLYATRNEAWLTTLAHPDEPLRLRSDLGGYRYVGAADLLARWDEEIGSGEMPSRRDPDVFSALLRAELEADPDRPRADAFRVPNGTLHELFDVFSGRALYAPGRLRCPTLLVRGTCDRTSTAADMRLLERELRHAPVRSVTLPDLGHFMQAERGAERLHDVVIDFLGADDGSQHGHRMGP